MMMKRTAVGVVMLAVVAAGAITIATGTTAPSAPAAASSSAPYRVPQGVKFNSPGDTSILGHIRRTINHVPKGEKIWIMSWNFQHRAITDALIDAHNRGVRVRLIMARQLAKKQGYGGSFKRFKRVTKRSRNMNRRKAMRSWARTCSHSCRGKGGSMHSKLMIVSKSGASTRIVQHGSSNITGSAGGRQWNDWYTRTGNRAMYRGWKKMFRQATQDRPFSGFKFKTGKHVSWFAPRKGDLVRKLLNRVTCKGARGAGINQRTAIRVASAVFQNERGIKIARKLKDLHQRGCNIRVVFTMMTNKIRRAIRGVPVKQLAYDYNGDGSFDRYLHMKVMTISGHYKNDRGARVVFNGSANWSRMGMVSDEQGMIIRGKGRLEKKYGKRISALYRNAPRGIRPGPDYYRARGMQNPYAGLELELAGQG